MLLYVTARRMRLTPPIRQYVQSRLIRTVERHAGKVDVTRMEVQIERLTNREIRFGCHVLLNMPGRNPINIREEARDLYETIDNADKRLARDLVDHIEKIDTLARFPTKYYAAKVVLGEHELRENEEQIAYEELSAPFETPEEREEREEREAT